MFIIAIAGVMLSEDPYGYYNGYQDLLCSFVFVLFFLKKCAIPGLFSFYFVFTIVVDCK